jgi:aminoglycoside/choline kinase family phosphotransferase
VSEPINPLITAKIRAVFGADQTLTALVPLAGDASSRRYYRAILSGTGTPPSIIVMELPAGSSLPLSSEELAIFKEGPKELPFLNVHRFLSRTGVNVPQILGAWEKDGILLLEDLGDTALWDRVQGLAADDTVAWYQKAIDELLKIQIRGTENRDGSCIAFQQRFDLKLYMWEFEHFIEWGLEKRPGSVVNHRDYHSWNLMIQNEAVRVIDFQDALMAPPQYDLASLLNDRVTDSVIRPALEERLVRYYIERRGELEKRKISADEFWEIYRLSAIQRDLKVVGRFYYLDLVKGKPGYMKFVPPTARRLERNLANVAQTQPVLELLREHFEAMR